MSLKEHEQRVAALAARVQQERDCAAQARVELMTGLRRTAREPATLCWSFAVGTLFGAGNRAGNATLAGRLADALRVGQTTWRQVRVLSALLGEAK